MNLVLFEPNQILHVMPRTDRRARHVIDVLRRKEGETFDVGIVNGPRGKATLVRISTAALELSFDWAAILPPVEPVTLVVGLPRPQTARDILRDATTLGVGALHFVLTEKGDSNYSKSTLWSSGEWRTLVTAGAEQAFSTRIPEVSHGLSLEASLTGLPTATTRIALDNYEVTTALSGCSLLQDKPVILALGGERGWSAKDRGLLRERGFALAHLGARVLRTETACTVALAIVRAKLNLI